MNETQIRAVLSQCSYRGRPLRLAHMCAGGYGVALDVEVEDAFHPGESLSTTRAVAIAGDDDAAVMSAAFDAVMRHERHEAAEFFTYRGTRPFDPHEGEAT